MRTLGVNQVTKNNQPQTMEATTINTLAELYSNIAVGVSRQLPRTQTMYGCYCDKRRKGANTSIGFIGFTLRFNHTILSPEVLTAIKGYGSNLTTLMSVLDEYYPNQHRIQAIDVLLADLA